MPCCYDTVAKVLWNACFWYKPDFERCFQHKLSAVCIGAQHSGLVSLLSSLVNPSSVDARRAPECWPFVHMWALTCFRDGRWVSRGSQLAEWTLKTLRRFASGLKASFIPALIVSIAMHDCSYSLSPLLGSSAAEAMRCLFQGSTTKLMWYC